MLGFGLLLVFFLSQQIDAFPKYSNRASSSTLQTYKQDTEAEDDFNLYLPRLEDDEDMYNSQDTSVPSNIFKDIRGGRYRRSGRYSANHLQYKRQSKRNRNHKRTKPRKSKKIADKIIWHECSPKRSKIYEFEDAMIYCSAIVTAGTTFKWHAPNLVEERLENDIKAPNYFNTPNVEYTPLPYDNLVWVRSQFYIDCPTNKSQGRYIIVATTPSGYSENKTFNVELDGRGIIGPMCRREEQECKVRVQEFIRRASLKENSSVTLPCRFTGPDCIVSWDWNTFNVFLDDDRYSLSRDGSLQISNLNVQDSGYYYCSCESMYGQCAGSEDHISFYLNVS